MITITTAASKQAHEFDASYATEENQAIHLLEAQFPMVAFSNIIENGAVIAWVADNNSVRADW